MNLSDLVIPPWVKPAIAAVALVGAFSAGWTVNGWRHASHEAKALKAAQAAFQRQLAQQAKEATTYEHDRETGRQENAARQSEIRTIYRDREVPADCAAPDSVRGLLDNAVNAANARAAGQPGATVPGAAESARRADRP